VKLFDSLQSRQLLDKIDQDRLRDIQARHAASGIRIHLGVQATAIEAAGDRVA